MEDLRRLFNVAASSRAYRDDPFNGDAWSASTTGTGFQFALIDGAGHGELAAESASVVKEVLENSGDLDLASTLARSHKRLQGMRGAVMSVVHIASHPGSLSFAGVGNVDYYLFDGEREQRLLPQRGMLGVTLPRVRVAELQLPQKWLLAAHTDGIRSQFTLRGAGVKLDTGEALQDLADKLLDKYRRADDDATVLLVAPSSQ